MNYIKKFVFICYLQVTKKNHLNISNIKENILL